MARIVIASLEKKIAALKPQARFLEMPFMRFFVQAKDWNPPEFVLHGSEAHHAYTVMRVREGVEARVFQGEGEEWLAKVVESTPQRLVLEGVEVVKEAQLAAEVFLLQALPKGSKMELIVGKAVELGVSEIWPLAVRRCVVRLDEKQAEKKIQKWQRLALEAAKQCGHPHVPQVAGVQSLSVALDELEQKKPDLVLLTSLQENTRPLLEWLQLSLEKMATRSSVPKIAVLIGPEGDFTEEEIHLCLQAGASPTSLGPLVLRTETAAICSLAQINAGLMVGSAHD